MICDLEKRFSMVNKTELNYYSTPAAETDPHFIANDAPAPEYPVLFIIRFLD